MGKHRVGTSDPLAGRETRGWRHGLLLGPASSRSWQFVVTARSAGDPPDRIGDARLNNVCGGDRVSFSAGASDALIDTPCTNDHEPALADVGELRELLNRG